MTQNELMMMHTLCGELYHARDALEGAKTVSDGVIRREREAIAESEKLRELNAMASRANEDLKARCTELISERDEARRKLGALALCVGFLEDYDTRHPKRSMETLKAAVKKCIDDNHIVLTEGGMAK